MQSVPKLFRDYVKTQTSITNLTTTSRLWVGSIPETVNVEDMPQALEIAKVGGNTDHRLVDLDRTHPVTRATLQVKCYGLNWLECENLEIALTVLLHGKQNIQVGSNAIIDIKKTSEGQQIQDPVTGWKYNLTLWDVKVQ